MSIINLVGDGTYGMVFSGKDKESGEFVALKKIKMEMETQGFPVTVSDTSYYDLSSIKLYCILF